MLETLKLLPSDPILGLLAAYRADPAARKLDLGVGVYKDEQGETPILEAVRAAEQALLAEQTTKAYIGPGGNDAFNAAVTALLLGEAHPALRAGRVRTLQSPGGCGALRLGAELIHGATAGAAIVHVSDPTWANHVPLLSGAGLKLERYPYYDPASGGVRFAAMLERLDELPAGSVVLLHGSCHNPTGADLTEAQWQALAELLQKRRLLPFVDIAYQGLGGGLEQDACGARLLAGALPEMLIAVSCSKNFGLYRERVGALIVVGASGTQAEAAASQLRKIARGLYSMPPDHGAAIVARILADAPRAALWHSELARMRERMQSLRDELTRALARTCPRHDFGAIARQRGMFSLLTLPPGAVDRLREQHHVYMTADGRINIAGLRRDSIPHLAEALGAVLAGGPV